MIRAVECLFLCLFSVELAWRRGGEGRERASRDSLFIPPRWKFRRWTHPPVFESRRDASSVECPTSRLTIVFAAGCAAESAWLRPTAARFNAEEGAGWKETRSRSISRITFVPGGGSSTPLCGCSADSHSVEENFDPFSVRAGFSNEVKLITLEIKIDSFRNVIIRIYSSSRWLITVTLLDFIVSIFWWTKFNDWLSRLKIGL